MPDEASMVESGGGLEPEGNGWFVVGVGETAWWQNEVFGAICPFEGNDDERRHRPRRVATGPGHESVGQGEEHLQRNEHHCRVKE